jgi:Tfp pilus assembly protein PilZ
MVKTTGIEDMKTGSSLSLHDRRKYPRIKAPIYYRPARFYLGLRPIIDIGLGGVRVYSDEKFKVGELLDLDLLLPDESILSFTVKIVWIKTLDDKQMASYDVGMEFLDIPPNILHKLENVLADEDF